MRSCLYALVLTVLTLLAMLSPAAAVPAARSDVLARKPLKCETTFASPTWSEIDKVVKVVEGLPNNHCNQNNPGGSKCHTIASVYGGDIGICGTPGKGWSCNGVAWAANEIKNACSWNQPGAGWKAGGTYWMPNGMRVILF